MITEPRYENTDGIVHRPMDIWAYDMSNGKETKIGTIDLQKYDISFTTYMKLFITDWKHDRLIIGATRQVLVPDYLVLDLTDMSISHLDADTIKQYPYSNIYINPSCDYIIMMGRDSGDSAKHYWEDQNVLYIFTFDAQSYSQIAKIRGISAIEEIIPTFSMPKDYNYLYIHNPLQHSWYQDIIRLSLPNLNIVDTLKVQSLCGDSCRFLTYDIQSNKAIIYVERNDNGSIRSNYMLVDLDLKRIISSLDVNSRNWARLSDDGEYIAIQNPYLGVDIYDTSFVKKVYIADADSGSLRYAFFPNKIFIIDSANEYMIKLKYDVDKGELIDKIIVENHEK
jgi:hypothetical protein